MTDWALKLHGLFFGHEKGDGRYGIIADSGMWATEGDVHKWKLVNANATTPAKVREHFGDNGVTIVDIGTMFLVSNDMRLLIKTYGWMFNDPLSWKGKEENRTLTMPKAK